MIFSYDKTSSLKDEYENGNINRYGINEKEYGPLKNDNNNIQSSNGNNQLWLKKTFKKYYFGYFANIGLPEKINLREFGFPINLTEK